MTSDRKLERDLKSKLSWEAREGLVSRLEQYLDLKRWEFSLSYVDPDNDLRVIYDSPYCRVKFFLDVDQREEDRIMTWYARSHVPNDVDLLMEWNGELCFAWHNLARRPFYEFLEGSTPEEAAEHDRSKTPWPAPYEFRETVVGSKLQQPDASAAFQAFLWEKYSDRLFSLFDMRQPERWEQFRRYLREYYKLRPFEPLQGDARPPRHQVC